MDLDTGLLRALTQVDADRSFGRAAPNLGLTQQALSKRIARLEQLVGSRLVDRADRADVHLTEQGLALLEPARRILAEVDALPVADAARPQPLVVDPLEPQLTPIRWLRTAQAEGVELVPVYRGTTGSATHTVRSGAADVAFGRVTPSDLPWPPGVHRRLVFLEPLHLLLPVSHPWAGEEELPLSLVRDSEIWFPMEGAPEEWRELVDELSRSSWMTVDVGGAALGYDYWLERVKLGTAPPSLVGSEMATAPGLRAVPLVNPTPVYPWWAMWRTGTDPSAMLSCTPLGSRPHVPSSMTDPAQVWMPASDRAAQVGQDDRSKPS